MRRRDELAKRKRLNFPHFCAVDVPDDRAAWSRRSLEMESWCRQRVGADGFAKQGRMGHERDFLEYRFKAPEVAAVFQAMFGGKLGAEQPAEAK